MRNMPVLLGIRTAQDCSGRMLEDMHAAQCMWQSSTNTAGHGTTHSPAAHDIGEWVQIIHSAHCS